MKVEDLSFPDPRQNLDYDDELLRRAELYGGEASGEVLRFWESPCVFVVMGCSSKEEADVDIPACAGDGIHVLRRSSGGGTVVQGKGCLNFSLVLAKGRDPHLQMITRSYEYILSKVLNALQFCAVKAEFRPVCDLVLADSELKFSGNAQRRGRFYLLHHGTILYGFDLSLIPRYLKVPLKMPEYRRGRGHEDFITNVSLDVPKFKAALSDEWR